MSEFTDNKKNRIDQLLEFFIGISKGKDAVKVVEDNLELINNTIPSDVVILVDRLIQLNIPIEELKKGINKFLNLLFRTIRDYPYTPPEKNSYFGCCLENNRQMDFHLKAIRPLIKKINKNPNNEKLRNELKNKFIDVEIFNKYYIIKENVLFPLLENNLSEYRCIQLMWSFHDDIRKNLKLVMKELNSDDFDLRKFNRLTGDIFFNMLAIKFREERILFPFIQENISKNLLNSLFKDSLEIGFPFFQPKSIADDELTKKTTNDDEINLKSGLLSVEQIRLLFNHLPVDITFVDENNKARYFSTPKKRIFPRTNAIIGRDVKNCHPPESVHIVEQIIEAFRKGEKDIATFYIKMKGEYVLIQYFAIHDEKGNYKGVIEVSQEISEIKNIQGEKRLLDWE